MRTLAVCKFPVLGKTSIVPRHAQTIHTLAFGHSRTRWHPIVVPCRGKGVILLRKRDSDNPVKDTIRLPVAEKPTDSQRRDLQKYFGEMPINEILAGLKFARNRWSAKDAGTLRVGRKSIIQKEVHSVTAEQARWRLKNWKIMIANYRRRGYSYPTIFRIKKALIQRSGDQPPP